MNVVVTILCLPMLILIKEKPPTPPSAIASKKLPPLKMLNDLKVLLKNKNYISLVLCFTFLYGIYTSLGAVVSFFTKPYYQPSDNSIFASCLILCGILGSFVISIILSKYAAYKISL